MPEVIFTGPGGRIEGRYHPARQRPPNNLEAPGQPTKGRPSRQIAATVAAERVAAGLNPHNPSPPVSPA